MCLVPKFCQWRRIFDFLNNWGPQICKHQHLLWYSIYLGLISEFLSRSVVLFHTLWTSHRRAPTLKWFSLEKFHIPCRIAKKLLIVYAKIRSCHQTPQTCDVLLRKILLTCQHAVVVVHGNILPLVIFKKE